MHEVLRALLEPLAGEGCLLGPLRIPGKPDLPTDFPVFPPILYLNPGYCGPGDAGLIELNRIILIGGFGRLLSPTRSLRPITRVLASGVVMSI